MVLAARFLRVLGTLGVEGVVVRSWCHCSTLVAAGGGGLVVREEGMVMGHSHLSPVANAEGDGVVMVVAGTGLELLL